MPRIDLAALGFVIFLVLVSFGIFSISCWIYEHATEKEENFGNPLNLKILDTIISKNGASIILYNPNDREIEFYISYVYFRSSLGAYCFVTNLGIVEVLKPKETRAIYIDFSTNPSCRKLYLYEGYNYTVILTYESGGKIGKVIYYG